MIVEVVLTDSSPFFCKNRLVSSLNGVVAQGGTTAPRLGCFRNW